MAMNVKQYIEKHADTVQKRKAFAERAGISTMYLGHLWKGRKQNPEFRVVMGLVKASEGKIKLKELRPDLFTDAEARRLIRKAAA